MSIAAFVGSVLALMALPGIIELAVLSLANLRRTPKPRAWVRPGFRLGVVIPAHNEEAGIGRTVRSVLDADHTGIDLTVMVVADNCTDGTGVAAAEAGARVLSRTDAERRGKGFALDFAFAELMVEGVDALLVVDADTVIGHNLLVEAAAAFSSGADAVQARYLVHNAGDSPRTRLMQIALMAFNVTRPRGRHALGLSAGINGNGFGVSRQTLTDVGYTASSIVEDLEYHLELVRARKRVRFLDRATVRADMPTDRGGAAQQRSRWEGGRARLAREAVPGLIRDVACGRWRLAEPLLDLLLPPLGLFAALLVATAAIPFAPSRAVGLTGLAVLVLHVAVAIRVGGGGWSDVRTLLRAPGYVLWKMAMLPQIGRTSRRTAAWVRTPREKNQWSR